MKGIFSYDNPVMRFIGKFWDVLILNLLWLICCIPVFTVGAATTAVYYVTLRLARDEDGYTIRSFFRSFKQNFRQATVIWLILLMVGIILFCDLWFVLTANIVPAGTPRILAMALFIGMLAVWFAVLIYVFPVLARFYGTIKQTITNAFLLSIRYILYTIAMIIVDLAIVFFTLTSLPVISLLGFALIAFLNSYILEHIFKKYIPQDERDIHDMRPLFADEEGQADEGGADYSMFVRTDAEAADGAESSGAQEADAGSTAGSASPETAESSDPTQEPESGELPDDAAESVKEPDGKQ